MRIMKVCGVLLSMLWLAGTASAQDADIASIINYVYASWDNSGKKVSEADVTKQRRKLDVSADKAQGEMHPGTPQSMESYQGAPSPAGAKGVEMIINPDAPSISKAEYTEATTCCARARPASR